MMTLADLARRPVRLPEDREAVLGFHCEANYESDTPWARMVPYEAYRAKWMSTHQPGDVIASIQRSLKDSEGLAEIWEEAGNPVAYLWLVFNEFEGYGIKFAEVNQLWIAQSQRRQGLGLEVLAYAESVAKANGAQVLRSEAGIDNIASQALHRKAEFEMSRLSYEKILVTPEELSRSIREAL